MARGTIDVNIRIERQEKKILQMKQELETLKNRRMTTKSL